MKNKLTDISIQRKKYLKNQRFNSITVWTSRIAILFLIVACWEFFTQINLIDPFLFSSPTRVLETLKLLYYDKVLFVHVFTTLYETVVGFLIASILGTLIAITLWLSDSLRKIFEPYIVILNALPKIALGPVIIIAFGAGIESIIFMTILVTIIVTIMNLLSGFIQTPSGKILLLKSMGANKFQILYHLVLPNALPTLTSTLKVNVGLSWIGSIMGEYIVSKQGLGYLIVYGGQVLKLDLVMTSTVLLCILASLMYLCVLLLEKLLLKWK